MKSFKSSELFRAPQTSYAWYVSLFNNYRSESRSGKYYLKDAAIASSRRKASRGMEMSWCSDGQVGWAFWDFRRATFLLVYVLVSGLAPGMRVQKADRCWCWPVGWDVGETRRQTGAALMGKTGAGVGKWARRQLGGGHGRRARNEGLVRELLRELLLIGGGG